MIVSLQEALYDPAVEYYTAHSKRVRRKRNRHSQAAASYAPTSPAIAGSPVRPLRPEGWNVRYEFKMACFAEFRGEYEVALKYVVGHGSPFEARSRNSRHYQDASSTLLMMFGSASTLPPRTKRWAEAKVLADTVAAKVVKLYLYNGEHALALFHHNNHVRKFGDLSRGWGIGEDTFEFWSWIARQCVPHTLSFATCSLSLYAQISCPC
jgi:trafficking protein particle complex subunit 11